MVVPGRESFRKEVQGNGLERAWGPDAALRLAFVHAISTAH